MTYASQADLESRFSSAELLELTDDEGLGVINTTTVGLALADADAEINSYLAAVYALPLTQTSPELVRLACDIARYRLWDQKSDQDQVKSRYEAAIAKLRDIAKGLASLGLASDNSTVSESGGVQVVAPARVFNASSMAGYGC